MRNSFVLTIIGNDRTGLVQRVADRIAAVGANWEESRMARLAGQFAGILLVTVDAARADELVGSLRKLDADGLTVSVRPTAEHTAPSATVRLALELTAHDRPGIVRDIATIFAERGINVEELESEVASAPMSGDPMFKASAILVASASTSLAELRSVLEALGGELMLDLSVAP
jgi:glycine cleavage system regulatory protein